MRSWRCQLPAEMPADLSSSISNERDNERGDSLHTRRERTLVTGIVFLSFLAFSAVRSPVPGVNEPHYLSKAKHFWDPAWCPGDFFLDSSNTHLVFYQTLGLLTRWLTLAQTAWAGRVIALLMLAVGWAGLVSRLIPGRWSSLWAAWTFLAMAAIGNFSGEWTVGGVESKLFCYAFVLQSLAFVCLKFWNRAAVCAGLAVSFHPVIGLWSLASGMFAGSVSLLYQRRSPDTTVGISTLLAKSALPASLLIACSLPGLIPALQLLGSGSPEVAFRANEIQVFHRLAHHLDPTRFPAIAYLCYGLLTVFWLIGRRRAGLDRRESYFAWFVLGSVLIALAGLVIGLGPRPAHEMLFYAFRMKLMKLYPFRLYDVMMLMAASVVLVGLAQRWLARERRPGFRVTALHRSLLAWLIFGGAMSFALLAPVVDRNPSKMNKQRLSDWLKACRWIADETPSDAHFLTPRESWAFKWYAQRAEFVVYKDCPQDAPSIVEWEHRLSFRDWAYESRNAVDSIEVFGRLHEEGMTHIISPRPGPFGLEPIYHNRTYQVYQLKDARVGSSSVHKNMLPRS